MIFQVENHDILLSIWIFLDSHSVNFGILLLLSIVIGSDIRIIDSTNEWKIEETITLSYNWWNSRDNKNELVLLCIFYGWFALFTFINNVKISIYARRPKSIDMRKWFLYALIEKWYHVIKCIHVKLNINFVVKVIWRNTFAM